MGMVSASDEVLAKAAIQNEEASPACLAQRKNPANPIPASTARPIPWGRYVVLGTRNEPDAKCGQKESADSQNSRRSLGRNGEDGWNRRTQHRGDGRGQTHFSGGQRAIEKSQGRSSTQTRRKRPRDAFMRWPRRVRGKSQSAYKNQSAGMGYGGHQIGIGAMRRVASGKIGNAPDDHCRQAERDLYQ